jgi:hypothetical protein
MFGDLITPSDAKVDTTFADESRNVCCRQEHQSKREILNECDVQPVVAVELDVRASEKIKACLLQSALFGNRE